MVAAYTIEFIHLPLIVYNPLDTNSMNKRVREHVDYKRNSIGVFKWRLDWLVILFELSIVFAFGMKGLFEVEI